MKTGEKTVEFMRNMNTKETRMKIATNRRGNRGRKILGTILLPCLAVVLLSLPGLSQATAMPESRGEKIEDLLPPGTLVFF